MVLGHLGQTQLAGFVKLLRAHFAKLLVVNATQLAGNAFSLAKPIAIAA